MNEQLTDQDYLRSVLEKNNVRLSRKTGQHFLVCSEVLEATLAALGKECSQVTELGAGIGTLTQALLGSGYLVTAIEKDTRLIALLAKCAPKKQRARLEILEGDLRYVDWRPAREGKGVQEYCLAGNIPYNLTGFIIRRITQSEQGLRRAVLLVQEEVAGRLTAGPGDMNLGALAVQLWGEATMLMRVPASCFFPPPEVTSAVVELKRSKRRGDASAREQTLAIAKHFFQAKRKQVGGTLRKKFNVPANQAEEILARALIDANKRPQEIGVEQWTILARELAHFPVFA